MNGNNGDTSDTEVVRERVNKWLCLGIIPLVLLGPWMFLMGAFYLAVPRPQSLIEWIVAVPTVVFCGYPIAYFVLLIAAKIERMDGKPRNTNWVATALKCYLYFLVALFAGVIAWSIVVGWQGNVWK